MDPSLSAGRSADRVAGLGARTIRNTALVLGARIASRLLALVAVVAIGNHLGDAGFGRFQTTVTYGALVAVVVDLGFNTLYVREGSRHPELIDRYLANVLSLKLLLSVAGLGVLALTLRLAGLGDLVVPGFVLMTLTAYSNLLRGTFYALQRLAFEAVDIVLESVILLAATAIGIVTHQGVAFFLWSYALSAGFSCVFFVTVLMVRGMARPRWRLDLDVLRPWFVTSLPLAVTYVMTNVYFKVDVPILQHYRSFEEVGWYQFAYKPFEALLFIPMTMRAAVFPLLSVYHRAAPDRVADAAGRFFKALLLLGLPCTVITLVLTPQITSLLRLFPQSEASLRILALGIVVIFVDNTFIATLNAVDRQTAYAGIAASGLVVNVALNLLLIPRYGYLAASWTTVLTEVQLAATGWVVLARAGHRLPLLRLSWRVLAAGAVMGLALLPLRGLHGGMVVVAALAGAVVYVVALAVLGAVDREEWLLLRRGLGR